MNEHNLPSNRVRTLLRSPLAASLAAVAFLAWLFLVCDVRQIFEFDSDDGNNVIKGLLLLEGASFGDQIWSDQPPVFSFLLAGAFRVFGTTMEVARGVVAIFSATILFALYELLRRWSGHLSALSCVVLLFLSSSFVTLSLSVMIGLPAIALAILGLLFLDHARQHFQSERPLLAQPAPCLWLGLAGFAGALSLGTKMFTAPVILLSGLAAFALGWGALHQAPPQNGEQTARLRASLSCGGLYCAGLLVGALLAFAPLIEAGTWSGLVEAHARSRAKGTGAADGANNLARFLADDSTLFTLTIVGGLVASAKRAAGPLFFALWLLACFLALYDHYPVWTHHRTLLTIPAAALAGYGIGELAALLEHISQPRQAPDAASDVARWSAGLLVLSLSSGLLLFSDKERVETLMSPHGWSKNADDWEIFEAFRVPAAASKYVATSRPTHAFRAGRPIPPNLAVTSSKRFATGLLSPGSVAADIQTFHPQTVLLSERWPASVRRAVKKVIDNDYIRVERWRYQRTELWVERSLAKSLGLEREGAKRRRVRRSAPEKKSPTRNKESGTLTKTQRPSPDGRESKDEAPPAARSE